MFDEVELHGGGGGGGNTAGVPDCAGPLQTMAKRYQ